MILIYFLNRCLILSSVIGGSTIGYLRDHCANNVYQLRNRKCIQNHKKDSLIIGFPGKMLPSILKEFIQKVNLFFNELNTIQNILNI